MDLTISIVSWNTRDLLDACLKSVYDTTSGIEFEIIVVDNASTDGTPEMIRDKYPHVIVIENKDNVGFARANNQAFEISSGEYFMLLNPDTVVLDEAVHKLIDVMRQVERCAVAAPKLLETDGRTQLSVCRFPNLGTELLDALFLSKLLAQRQAGFYEPPEQGISRVDCARGACLLVRRSALTTDSSLLDERYFMFSEEVDLCRTVQSSGWLTCYEPSARVVHLGSGSTSQVKKEMLAQLYQSKFLYFSKHHTRFYAAVYRKCVLPLHCALRLLLYPLTRVMSTSRKSGGDTSPGTQLHLLKSAFRWNAPVASGTDIHVAEAK